MRRATSRLGGCSWATRSSAAALEGAAPSFARRLAPARVTRPMSPDSPDWLETAASTTPLRLSCTARSTRSGASSAEPVTR